MHHLHPRRSLLLLQGLKKALESRRPDAEVVLLGIGSELRSDDAVGLVVARAASEPPIPAIHCIEAGPAPENFTAEIRRIAPSHLIMVDAAQMDAKPGTTRLLDPARAGGASFATHGLPLGVLAGYLESEIGCAVMLIGIQPQSLEFGEKLTPEVAEAADALVEAIRACLAPRAAAESGS
jgi:hydrogenase 3 maturation protease